MKQEELTALIVIKIENLGIDYRTFDYDNQRAWIDTRLCIGGYNPNTATPFDHAHEYIHAYYKDDRRLGECDTLSPAEKRANKEGYIIDTPNRSELWITQTPQSFKTDLVKMAYKKMKEELEKGNTTLNITDDAMVVEEFTTNQVRFVQGDYKNIKVTTPEDIDIAELFIELDAK